MPSAQCAGGARPSGQCASARLALSLLLATPVFATKALTPYGTSDDLGLVGTSDDFGLVDLGPGGCPSSTLRPCSGHGGCRTGTCICDRGWGGPSCDRAEYLLACPANCSASDGGGACVGARCVCAEGRSGDDCADRTDVRCEPGCSGHGECLNGRCSCFAGFHGENCMLGCAGYVPATQKPCSGRGLCRPTGSVGHSAEVCHCFVGFEGEGCEKDVDGVASCARDCSGRGACYHGRCSCEAGYAGHDCSIELRHGEMVHALDGLVAKGLAALLAFVLTAGLAALAFRYTDSVETPKMGTPMQMLGAEANRKGGV